MLHITPRIRFRSIAGVSLVLGMALLTGCAQQQRPAAGYYDTPHDSTLADAQQQAQGRRGARAPSQLQIGFGETEAERANRRAQEAVEAEAHSAESSASPSTARPLLEPKTFLGTLPCVNSAANCPAMRMTLTLAPSGEWRARTVPVNAAADNHGIAQQGCWDVMGTNPLRIVLQTQGQESSTSLTFVNDNVLRVAMYNDIRPMLDYHLTRQADIDPIDELADRPTLNCN